MYALIPLTAENLPGLELALDARIKRLLASEPGPASKAYA